MALFSKPQSKQNNRVVFRRPKRSEKNQEPVKEPFLQRLFGDGSKRRARRERKEQEAKQLVERSPTLSFLKEKVADPLVRFDERLSESNQALREAPREERKEMIRENRKKVGRFLKEDLPEFAKQDVPRFFKPGEKVKLEKEDPTFGTEKRETSKFGKLLGTLGKEIVRGVGRISLGASELGEKQVVSRITGEEGTPRTEELKKRVVDPIFGLGEELRSPQAFAREMRGKVEEKGASEGEAKAVFTAAIIGSLFAESPFGLPGKAGKADDLFKAIAKTDDVVAIEKALVKEGLDEATSKTYAKALQKVDDPKAIENFLKKEVETGAEVLNRVTKQQEAPVAKQATDIEPVQTPRFQKSTQRAVDASETRLKKEFEAGQKKLRQISEAQEEAIFPTQSRVPLKGAVERKLQPFKFTEPEVQKAFKEWESSTLKARQLADQEVEKLAKGFPIDKNKSFKVITEYQAGVKNSFTDRIKTVFDDLYKEAKSRGLDTDYRANYIPQVYKESSEEVMQKISNYLADQGMKAEDIKNYIRGRALPANEAAALKLRPNFTKERVFPSYEVAAKYGLTPKYQHPAQLAAFYREEMEKTIANMKFVDEMVESGKILKAGDAPTNWKSIDAPSFQGYKAPGYLAEAIDGLFKREAGQFNVRDRIVEGVAMASKRLQEIALSGGVPLTNVNFFSIGQTIKEMTRGNFKAVSAFVRANFNDRSVKYLKDNQKYLEMMAEEGINLGDHVASYSRTFDQLKDKLNPAKKETWSNFFGNKGTFDILFNDKTFSSFMPQLHMQVFKDTFEASVKKGMAKAEAKKLAADITKKTFGLVDQWGRSKGTQDVMSATFFAPRFREGILNTLWNTGKSVTTEFRNPAFKNNRRLALGMLVTYAGYNALNKALNGHYMWENPKGRTFALRIPIEDGKGSMYVEFMPSFLAFGRNLIQGALATAKGDVKEAGQKFGSVFSMPVKLVSEALSNKDYFGREIYDESDALGTKISKVSAHFGLAVAHPFIKEFIKQQGWDKGETTPKEERPPMYQAMLRAMELPVKFGTKAKEDAGEYYENLREEQEAGKKKRKKYEKVLDRILEVRDVEGDKARADAMFEALTAEEKKIVTSISKARKTAETRQRKVELYSMLLDIRELHETGRSERADELYAALDAEDKKLITQVSKENPAKKVENKEPIEEGTLSEERAKSQILQFAKAFGVSPVVAFKILVSRNKIEYVKNGVIKVERLPFRGAESSSFIRAEGGAGSDVRLDHTIPLQLGGTNAAGNLKLVPTEDWASYTPVENELRRQVMDGKISLMKARNLIKRFKAGKITKEQALDN
jgi:hypothetical protein